MTAQKLSRFHHGRQVLHGINLELRRGEVLGLLGPNGAGKSTTMNILAGVLAAHGGCVRICGQDISRAPRLAKRHIGYLPEIPPLYLDATVDEYLYFCAQLRGLTSEQTEQAVARCKRECDLESVGQRLLANLSKGYRQRAGIAQAILHRPAVVILDEPTSGLDPNQIRGVRDIIRDLVRHHAVILSTHILSEAQTLCSRVAILHDGRITFDQPIATTHHAMRVRFGAQRSPEDLLDIVGVNDCEDLGDAGYRLTVDDYDTVSESITATAVERSWGLREMYLDPSPLEQVFINLTCNDIRASE